MSRRGSVRRWTRRVDVFEMTPYRRLRFQTCSGSCNQEVARAKRGSRGREDFAWKLRRKSSRGDLWKFGWRVIRLEEEEEEDDDGRIPGNYRRRSE